MITDEMRERLELICQSAQVIQDMLDEQEVADYELKDYDEPVTDILGNLNEVMEEIDGGHQYAAWEDLAWARL